MSFLSSLVSVAAPLIGGAFGGPLGASIGGSLGGFISKNGTGIGQAIGSGFSEYSAQNEAQKGAELRNAQQVAQSTGQMEFQTAANQKQMDFQTAANYKQMVHQNESVQRQMDFQERMSNTAHQREMGDLANAGLNPILAAKLGGASSPAGGSSSGSTSSGATSGGAQAAIMDAVGPAMATGLAAKRLDTEMSQMREQLLNTKAERARTEEQTELTRAQERDTRRAEQLKTNQIEQVQAATAREIQETATEREHTANANLSNIMTRLHMPGQKLEAEIDQSDFGKAVRYLSRLNPFASSAAQIGNSAAQLSNSRNFRIRKGR